MLTFVNFMSSQFFFFAVLQQTVSPIETLGKPAFEACKTLFFFLCELKKQRRKDGWKAESKSKSCCLWLLTCGYEFLKLKLLSYAVSWKFSIPAAGRRSWSRLQRFPQNVWDLSAWFDIVTTHVWAWRRYQVSCTFYTFRQPYVSKKGGFTG